MCEAQCARHRASRHRYCLHCIVICGIVFVMEKNLYHVSFELEKIRRRRIATVVFMVVVVFCAVSLTISFLIFPVRQISKSMEPDFAKGTCMFFTPLLKKPNRGDIVMLNSLGNKKLSLPIRAVNTVCRFFTLQQYSPFQNKFRMGDNETVRRVVGLPGDTIYMRDYVAFVRSEGSHHFLTEFELVKKTYNVNITLPPSEWERDMSVSGDYKTITLGEGEYFVLGDNRYACLDSRVWGVVRSTQINATAVLLYFPLSKINLL